MAEGGQLQQLANYGFRSVGVWRTPECRVHHPSWLHGRPGIYAFVVSGEVRYVGKAGRLHRRLRRYSNRCFGKPGGSELRHCHREIVLSVRSSEIVHVYAMLDDGRESLAQQERKFIDEFKPAWNQK